MIGIGSGRDMQVIMRDNGDRLRTMQSEEGVNMNRKPVYGFIAACLFVSVLFMALGISSAFAATIVPGKGLTPVIVKNATVSSTTQGCYVVRVNGDKGVLKFIK